MLETIIIDNFLAIAKAYAKATGKSLTTVSKDFYGRGDFLSELGKGTRSVTVGSLSQMLDRFRKEWPDDAAWPFTRTPFMTKHPGK